MAVIWLQAPNDLLTKPLDELVGYLVGPYKTDLQKVRSVYRWITAQNPKQLSESTQSAADDLTTAFDHLNALKNETISYNVLLEKMCR